MGNDHRQSKEGSGGSCGVPNLQFVLDRKRIGSASLCADCCALQVIAGHSTFALGFSLPAMRLLVELAVVVPIRIQELTLASGARGNLQPEPSGRGSIQSKPKKKIPHSFGSNPPV
jgi:hypothetical protein